MSGTTVDIPLENQERTSPLKKLCIDRGADRLRPPVAYEHWNDDGINKSGRLGSNNRRGGRIEVGSARKTANFARPSSVSADTPNFFKVPGVAINSSSAITGVEAICSPPPKHQPFGLPETYMHGRDVQAVVDPIVLPGRWRQTDAEAGQWGHATQEFHEQLVKMRHESAARARPQGTSSRQAPHPKTKRRETPTPQLNGSNDPAAVATGTPRHHQARKIENGDARGMSAQLPHCNSRPASSAGGSRSRPALGLRQSLDSVGSLGGGRDVHQGGRGRDQGGAGTSRTRPRRASAVEVFMSRLEGNRGPQNRRESVAIYKQMLRGCPINNSAWLGDDDTAEASRNSPGTEAAEGKHEKNAALRRVLARREAAHKAVSGLMCTPEGSYMLSRGGDAFKTSLGRTQTTKTPPVGLVRMVD